MNDLLHPEYLPFTAATLKKHFVADSGGDEAFVVGTDDDDRHLRYYQTSIGRWNEHAKSADAGEAPSLAATRIGRQAEKDERFWVATALLTLFYADGGADRVRAFSDLLQRAGLRPPPGCAGWTEVLSDPLDLFLEVNLPSPRSYREWLRAHLDERVPDPLPKRAGREATSTPGRTDPRRCHADRP